MNVSDHFDPIDPEIHDTCCPICHEIFKENVGYYLKEEPEFQVCSSNCARKYLVDNGDYYRK